MRLLVIAAHPDDEVLGCGGTIARLASTGDVHIAILGEGVTARSMDRTNADQPKIDNLYSHARQVSKLLGAKSISFDGFPDNRFDTIPLLDVVKCVERIIDEFSPSIVFTHHPGDLNIDHQVTFRSVLTATRPAGAPGDVSDIYSFEIPSSTEWSFQMLSPQFKPTIFYDVTDTIDLKIQGMESYRSETRPFPHPRSPQALRAIARRWGSVIGVPYAEPFELVRSIRL